MNQAEQRDNYAITVLLHQLSLFSLGSRQSGVRGAIAPCRPRAHLPPDLRINLITTSDSGPLVRCGSGVQVRRWHITSVIDSCRD